MRLTNRPVEAWLCCPDSSSTASLARRLRTAGAVDEVRIMAPADEIPSGVELVVLVSDGHRLPDDELVAAVRTMAPHATVLVPLAGVTITEVVDLLSGGVDAVVDLDADDRALAHGVRAAVRDRSYVPGELQAAAVTALARRRRRETEARARLASLTSTEREILALLIAGVDRSTIAARSNESVPRVRARIDRVKSKLGVASQRDAVAMAAGYLSPSS